MSAATNASAAPAAIPPLTMATIGLMFMARAVATTAFDTWGQIISPGIGWANLSPHGFARSLLGRFGLPNDNLAGYFVHFYLVGLTADPLLWLPPEMQGGS